ncbi:MAG TPA: hypothetical protein VKB19_09885 [Pedobacter sp.]|nr:hypothetical protein [Pedobacter sp.]
MRILIGALAIIAVFFNNAHAQQKDSVQAKAEYGFKSEEVRLLAELENIDFYKVTFNQKSLKGNPFLLFTTREYLKGKVTRVDTLIPLDMARNVLKFKNIDSNSILTLTTKPEGDSVKFLYHILNLKLSRTYKRLNDDAYSLRDGLVTNEDFKKVPLNATLPLFAYSLPYDDPKQPGYRFYCAITANGVPPEKWWERYKIPHYIIVEMRIISE